MVVAGIGAFLSPLAAAIPIVIIVLVLGVGGYIAYVLFFRRGGGGKAALIFDANRGKVVVEDIEEIAPHLYRTESGDILLVPSDARLYRFGNREVYPAVRLGKRLVAADGDKLLTFYVMSSAGRSEVNDVADLIAALVDAEALSKEVRVSPGVEVSVAIEPRRAAEMLIDVFDRSVEDAVVSITNLTGARKEFEATVKALAMYERERRATFESRMMWIIAGGMVLAIIVFMLASLLK